MRGLFLERLISKGEKIRNFRHGSNFNCTSKFKGAECVTKLPSNRVAKRAQHVALNNVGICGTTFKMLGYVALNVAIVWPGLSTSHTAMFLLQSNLS